MNDAEILKYKDLLNKMLTRLQYLDTMLEKNSDAIRKLNQCGLSVIEIIMDDKEMKECYK